MLYLYLDLREMNQEGCDLGPKWDVELRKQEFIILRVRMANTPGYSRAALRLTISALEM